MSFLQKHTTKAFVYYRWAVAILLVAFALARGLIPAYTTVLVGDFRARGDYGQPLEDEVGDEATHAE